MNLSEAIETHRSDKIDQLLVLFAPPHTRTEPQSRGGAALLVFPIW
jgi:hypothetical protein